MLRGSVLAGVAILGLTLIVGTGVSQVTKRSGQLPAGWSKLNLSKEQKTKVYGVMADYKVKIQELEMKLEDLKAERLSKMVQVLTPDQKETLKRLTVGEGSRRVPPPPPPPGAKKQDQ